MATDVELGEIFFTAYDEKITGTSQRDPLGLQIIWAYYGRRMINHLTTISDDIRGFREVVLCLSICNDCYKNQNSKQKYSLKELILLFEQLFIYSTIKRDASAGILGADNGKIRYKDKQEDTIVSFSDTLLVREISLGYYGRYKNPLLTMGIIDNRSRVSEKIDINGIFGKPLYQRISEAFRDFIERMAVGHKELPVKAFEAGSELYEAVCGKLREKEEKLWLGWFIGDEDSKGKLMKSCYDTVNQENVGELAIESLSYTDIAKDSAIDIIRIERFLRCLEYVFYEVLRVKKISSFALVDEMRVEHKKRYEEFCQINDPNSDSNLLVSRIKYIKKNCNPESEGYIKSVIDYHKMVCEQKKSSPRLELENGNIQAFVQSDKEIDIKTWGRDYYFASLWGIKSGIEGLRDAKG